MSLLRFSDSTGPLSLSVSLAACFYEAVNWQRPCANSHLVLKLQLHTVSLMLSLFLFWSVCVEVRRMQARSPRQCRDSSIAQTLLYVQTEYTEAIVT